MEFSVTKAVSYQRLYQFLARFFFFLAFSLKVMLQVTALAPETRGLTSRFHPNRAGHLGHCLGPVSRTVQQKYFILFSEFIFLVKVLFNK